MDSIRLAFNTLHSLFAGVFGLTIIDVVSLSQFDFLKGIDEDAKHIFIVVGLVYYIVALLHKLKMNKFKRREKQLEFQTKELNLKIEYDKYDLDVYKKSIGFKDKK